MQDHYADGTYKWWHLSDVSPELVAALQDDWLPTIGRALDVGCGLGTEAGHLAQKGWRVIGVDLSPVALASAVARQKRPSFLRADVIELPFVSSSFDAVLDRGCFHYVRPPDRSLYAAEIRRVLRPKGKLLLRACLRAAAVRNDIDEQVILETFSSWRIERLERASIPSDTRSLEALVVHCTA